MSSRVFELLPVRRKVKSTEAPITCLHGSGNTVFVGHESGEIIAYSIRESGSGAEAQVEADFWAATTLRGSIQALGSASALARLFVLFDSTFWLLHLQDMAEVTTGKTKLRHVTCFALNENPPLSALDDPFSVLMAFGSFGRERNGPGLVRLAAVSADRITFTAELSTASSPLSIGFDSSAVCFGTRSCYYVHGLGDGVTHELFPLDESEGRPLVARVEAEEFVVSGMSGLGVFVAGGGVSKRAPFKWGLGRLVGVAVSFPYIVALGEESVAAHSILDQDIRQELSLASGAAVENCDGQLFVASARTLYKLPLVSWITQIEALLAEKRITEAREVARFALKAGSVQDSAIDIFQQIDARGAFVELEMGNWDEAVELALNSQIDLREVMSLFPGLLPSDSLFRRQTNPALHSLGSVETLGLDADALWAAALTLLRQGREAAWTAPYRRELNTGLAKAAARCRSCDFSQLLDEADGTIDVDDVRAWLSDRDLHHAKACLLFWEGKQTDAVGMWRELEEGSKSDEAFEGFQTVLPKVLSASNAIIMETADWLLDRTPALAIKLFMDLAERTELSPGIISILEKHKSRSFMAQYLASLLPFIDVDTARERDTQLALLYADLIVTPELDGLSESTLRARLRRFLLQTSRFDSAKVLAVLEQRAGLSTEAAFLKGKLGDHAGALELLVGPDGDATAAEEYVGVVCESLGRRERRPLHSALFRLLLSRPTADGDVPVRRLLALLDRPDVELEATEVIDSLPPRWSLGALSGFLRRSGAETAQRRRAAELGRQLAAAQVGSLRRELARLTATKTVVADSDRCGVCGDLFLDPEVIRYPGGSLVHPGCLRHASLCPVSHTFYPMRSLRSTAQSP